MSRQSPVRPDRPSSDQLRIWSLDLTEDLIVRLYWRERIVGVKLSGGQRGRLCRLTTPSALHRPPFLRPVG